MKTSLLTTSSFEENGKLNWSQLTPAFLIALICLVFYCFTPYVTGYESRPKTIAIWIYDFWQQPDGDWSHGMLILPFCIGIIYLKRHALGKIPLCGENWGIILMVIGFFSFWLGLKADVPYPAYVSAHLLIAGMIIWFYGWPLFKALLFPWFFLVFLWPLPFLDNVLAFPLRLLMSKVAYHFFNLIGIPCLQIGTAIASAPDEARHLPVGGRFAIDVANPCSGLRSLFALMMLTALYAYFVLPKTWQKCLLFMSSMALAILGNVVRILMLIVGTLAFGSAFAIGTLDQPSTFHMLAGFAVFVVALGGMIALSSLLQFNFSRAFLELTKSSSHKKDDQANEKESSNY